MMFHFALSISPTDCDPVKVLLCMQKVVALNMVSNPTQERKFLLLKIIFGPLRFDCFACFYNFFTVDRKYEKRRQSTPYICIVCKECVGFTSCLSSYFILLKYIRMLRSVASINLVWSLRISMH